MDDQLYVVVARHQDGTIYSTSYAISEAEVPAKIAEYQARWNEDRLVEVISRKAYGPLLRAPQARVVGGVPR